VAPATQSCVQRSLEGRADAECVQEPDNNLCVGLKRALQNVRKREQCAFRVGDACLMHSYKQNTEVQWVSVAAGYLTAFGQCVTKAYGSDDSQGYREALADAEFVGFLRTLDDGGDQLGFHQREILERILNGETFESIVRTSEVVKSMSFRNQRSFLVAAETPFPIPDSVTMGENAMADSGEKAANNRSTKTIVSRSVAATTSEKPPVPVPALATVSENKTPAASAVYVRNLKRNPYSLGLDLSLFERVSQMYQKKSSDLRGFEDYLRRLPSSAEPTDVRKLIKRHTAVEL
jgi:hypothetical protein